MASWFFHVVQYQRWEKAVSYLKHATFNNLALKNGGTKETLAMYNRAVAQYEEHCAKRKTFVAVDCQLYDALRN